MISERTIAVVRRGILRGATTVLRERQWLTALGALCGVLVLVQLLLLVLTGLEGAQAVLRNRTDLRLEIRAEATDEQVQSFFSTMTQLPFVQEAAYIPKEKAYEDTRNSDPELIRFLEEFQMENPFSDTIGVRLRSLEDYESFAAFTEEDRWRTVINPSFLSQMTDQERNVFALLEVTRAGRAVTVIILLLAATALVFITTELIRRRALARWDEVLVERLSGATPLSIVVPFITEATILLLLSIILSGILLLLFMGVLPMFITALRPSGALGTLRAEIVPLLSTLLPLLLLVEVLLSPVIGTLGAWLGIHPQIRSPRISLTA